MIHENPSQHEPASAENSIRVGACGWDQAHWRGSFYPDDLPEDWRLSYYANEFSVVLVPESVWYPEDVGIEEPAINDWGDEVQDNFRFYLQVNNNSVATNSVKRKALEHIKHQLGDSFAGLVDTQSPQIDENTGAAVIYMAEKDLRGWRKWLQQNAALLKVIFLCDQQLSYKQLNDFKSLLELLNL